MKSSGNASTPAACASPSEGGERKSINPELWYACAGPLVNLPQAGSFVVYFPQGHSEQVAATMQKSADVQIPNYPNLPWKMICLLHNVTLHADPETDEVYAQMTLQPVNTNEKEAFLASDPSTKSNRPQTEFFCKTLTASDTSTHGGFSVPRRAAEKIFPPLDFSLQPPAQELQARDLHDNVWTFRHIYRGQPKRHLLTTGWSLFVSGKRLLAGDSVLVIRDEKQQLLLGIRRANRQPTNMSSSVLSSDSMQIGILAAAAHAYANNSPFTVFYNPRASSSEFVIPLAKYNKVIYSNQISLGMRFRMMFETEESGTRRYMGTVTGISDLDPVRWKNSKWRNLQVGWDESAAGERRNRVSMWEIEPVQAPFFICPPPFFRSKRPRQPGMPEDDSMDVENLFKRAMPWLGDEICMKDPLSQNSSMPGLSLVQWMNMQNSSLANSSIQSDYLRSLTAPVLQNYATADLSKQLSLQAQILQQNNIQFNAPKPLQQIQQADQLSKLMIPPNQTGTVPFHPNQSPDINQKQMQQMAINQALPLNQNQNLLQPPMPAQNQGQQQQPQIQNSQHTQTSSQLNQSQQIPQQLLQQQILHAQQSLPQQQQEQQHQHQEPQQLLQSRMPTQLIHQANQQIQLSEQQIQLQILQKLQQQQQQQSLLTQAMLQHPQHTPEPQKVSLDVAQHMPNISSLSQQHIAQHQSAKGTTAVMTPSQSIQHQPQQKFQPSQVVRNETNGFNLPRPYMNLPSTTGSLLSGGTHSVLTEDAPSCSTSPSSNNCSVIPQTVTNRTNCTTNIVDVSQTGVTMLGSGSFEAFPTSTNTAKDLPKPDVKPSISIPKSLNQAYLAPQSYLSNAAPMDYLDASSSATSMCVSQTDQHLQQNFTLHPSNQQTLFFRDGMQESDIPVSDPRNNVLFGVNIDIPLEIPMPGDPLLTKNVSPEKEYQHNLVSKIAIPNYNGSKEAQAEPSTSIVSQSFVVAEVAFNSIDSTINDGSLLNKCTWGPTPQIQRMRTYTKVYKRGAVGRSIDITRYSGYDELKQDLARMFSIEGQLEDRQRIGWKLVYVDHESDVLLVGDDPWEEFVSCVRCIRILSPQEEQQMSLDGDIGGNNVLPNQACSSSDGGNVWRGKCDQNNNPSAGSYGHID